MCSKATLPVLVISRSAMHFILQAAGNCHQLLPRVKLHNSDLLVLDVCANDLARMEGHVRSRALLFLQRNMCAPVFCSDT